MSFSNWKNFHRSCLKIKAKNGVKFRGSASILQRAKTRAPRFSWLHPNKLVSQTYKKMGSSKTTRVLNGNPELWHTSGNRHAAGPTRFYTFTNFYANDPQWIIYLKIGNKKLGVANSRMCLSLLPWCVSAKLKKNNPQFSESSERKQTCRSTSDPSNKSLLAWNTKKCS